MVVARFVRLLHQLVLPVGIISLVLLGVHAGSDRLDDYLYYLLQRLDLFIDRLLHLSLAHLGDAVGWSSSRIQRLSYLARNQVGSSALRVVANYIALVIELGADILLCFPLLSLGSEQKRFSELFQKLKARPHGFTIIASSFTVLFSFAGSFSLAREAKLIAQKSLYQFQVSGQENLLIATALAAFLGALVFLALTPKALKTILCFGLRLSDQQHLLQEAAPIPKSRNWLYGTFLTPLVGLSLLQASHLALALYRQVGGLS